MNKQNLEELEKKTLKKAKQREKKRKPAMRVSGVGVKKLQKIITRLGD